MKSSPLQGSFAVRLEWGPYDSADPYYFDLDLSCFMLDKQGALPRDEYFVFYHNKKSYDGSVMLKKDDRLVLKKKSKNSEELVIKSEQINQTVVELVVIASINQAIKLNQRFGHINDARAIVLLNRTAAEIYNFDLEGDFATDCSVEICRITRSDSGWCIDPSGTGVSLELDYFVKRYNF